MRGEPRLLAFLRDELMLLDPRKYFYVEDRFERRPIVQADLDWDPATTPTQVEMRLVTQANKNWNAQGTGASSALSSLSTSGGSQIVATAGSNQAVIGPATVNAGTEPVSALGGTQWSTDKEIFFGMVLRPIATTCQFMMGFKLTNGHGKSTDANQAIFHFDPADGVDALRFRIISSNANVDTEKVARVEGALHTNFADLIQLPELRMVVAVDRLRVPHFYINERLVGAGAPLAAATNLIPFCGAQRVSGTVGQIMWHSIVGRAH